MAQKKRKGMEEIFKRQSLTIDTNILIAYSSGETDVVQTMNSWRENGKHFIVSTVAESEFLAFSEFSETKFLFAQNFLWENFIIANFDSQLAVLAARIRRHKKIKFPDSAIAATALHARSPLVTRNTKDFKNIPNLQIITI